jgi:PAS domain S-box-containing protein
MSERKSYAAPRLIRHKSMSQRTDETGFFSRSQEFGFELSEQGRVRSECVAVVDNDRNYIEVSDSFCELVGYKREELLRKRYDELSAPNTNDILCVYRMFQRLGYMHGLWMLVSRGGTRILVRYEAWLRPDSMIEGHMEVVGAGY